MKDHFVRNAGAYFDGLTYFVILAGNAYLGSLGKLTNEQIAGMSVHDWIRDSITLCVSIAVTVHAYRRKEAGK